VTWTSLAMLGWVAAGVAVAWLPPRRWQVPAFALFSAVFLAWYAPLSAGLLAVFTVGTHLVVSGRGGPQRALGAVAAVAGTLVAFKLGVTTEWGGSEAGGPSPVPLGLSFYALRTIHVLMERYKGALPEHSFTTLAAYLFFLPILPAGPIARLGDFQRELRRRRFDGALFSRGLERILHGYAKIVILGNYLVSMKFAEWIQTGLQAGSPAQAYLDCLRYGSNLYFQFGGYSDVAIGFALLVGVRVAENFRWPFLAENIGEFWRRWHITLAEWCRDYVFMPVASWSRSPSLAVVASMIVLGVWHELSWRYLAWGVYHGLGIAVWRAWSRRRPAPTGASGPAAALRHGARVLVTFHFVLLSFAITKEPDLGAALGVYRALLGLAP
jgi:alginate O-acetyltransferase complex protein AlgI